MKEYPYDTGEDEWSKDYLEGTNVRVLRGGSWDVASVGFARCASRTQLNPYSRSFNWGVRLLVSHIFLPLPEISRVGPFGGGCVVEALKNGAACRSPGAKGRPFPWMTTQWDAWPVLRP